MPPAPVTTLESSRDEGECILGGGGEGRRERSVFTGGLRCVSCSIQIELFGLIFIVGISHQGWSERCVWFVEHVPAGRRFCHVSFSLNKPFVTLHAFFI